MPSALAVLALALLTIAFAVHLTALLVLAALIVLIGALTALLLLLLIRSLTLRIAGLLRRSAGVRIVLIVVGHAVSPFVRSPLHEGASAAQEDNGPGLSLFRPPSSRLRESHVGRPTLQGARTMAVMGMFGSRIWPFMTPSPLVSEVGAARMARTTSMPSTTLPKAAKP